MKQIIDARGLDCPQPVVLTDRAIEIADSVTVIVDTASARANVTRRAHEKGFRVTATETPDGVHLDLTREGGTRMKSEEIVQTCSSSSGTVKSTVVFVPSDCLGRGPVELGERLMSSFFHSLLEIDTLPSAIVFMNSGVKLAVEDSRSLEDLRELFSRGIDILACGTCLGYFELTEKLAVGRISNMYDIATILLKADIVVEL